MTNSCVVHLQFECEDKINIDHYRIKGNLLTFESSKLYNNVTRNLLTLE